MPTSEFFFLDPQLTSRPDGYNHTYLVCLVSALMILVPADAAWALRVSRKSKEAPQVLQWHLWLLRAQIAVVYFFGGIAKINGDWLRAVPLRTWLSRRSHYPVIGDWLGRDSGAYFFSYSGLLFDLLVVPLLLHRKTRVPALAAALVFHLLNAWIFGIGIFPWFMLFATTLFFDADWPRQVWSKLRSDIEARRTIRLWPVGFATVLPYFLLREKATLPCVASGVAALLIVYGPQLSKSPGQAQPSVLRLPQALVLGFAATWVAIQIVIPLRHHLIPGDVAWTEEGHRFSWRMKLRQKTGEAVFFVERPTTGETIVIYPAQELTSKQYWKMVGNPHFLQQYAHHLATQYAGEDDAVPIVRANASVSLNGRPYRPLVDASANLAASRSFLLRHQPWITETNDPPPKGRGSPIPPRVSGLVPIEYRGSPEPR